MVPTCTNPLYQTRSTNQQELCPKPPQVSVADVRNNTSGPLDSDNVFVDETLLRKGAELGPEVYVRRIQAGFVISYRDPPYAACGCSEPDSFVENYINELSQCTSSDGSEIYALRPDSEISQCFNWLDRDCSGASESTTIYHSAISGNGSGNGSGSGGGGDTEFTRGYEVDGLSANVLQVASCANLSCGGSNSPRPIAKFFQKEPPEIAATVYYNNNVSCDLYIIIYEF